MPDDVDGRVASVRRAQDDFLARLAKAIVDESMKPDARASPAERKDLKPPRTESRSVE